MRALKNLALVLAATTALTACVTPYAGNDGMYALPIGDAPVTANPTAYSPALDCLAQYARQNQIAAPRIAVGRILDYTGSVSEEGGRRITQGASLMAMSAFNKAGARLVERFDTSVTEVSKRSTKRAPALLKADIAISEAPCVMRRPPSSETAPV